LSGLRGLRLRSALALHVDAATEMRAFGNRHTRRHDVPVDRTVVADVDLIARRDVAGDLAEHDDGLGEDLSFDPAVRSDGQHVLAELNRALDLSFDREVFAAIELALDHDRLPNIHDVLLHHVMTRLLARTRAARHRRCRGRRGYWLPACGSDVL